MRVTIDATGRLVLPKALRDAMGIAGATTVEVALRDGRIEIAVPSVEMRIEKRGDVVVAVPAHAVLPLRAATSRATLDVVRARA